MIRITEVIDDNRQTIGDGVFGHVLYKYNACTHWSSSGVVTIMENWENSGKVSVSLNWGSGGVNSGYTEIEVADVMSRAFAMARDRIIIIEDMLREHNK